MSAGDWKTGRDVGICSCTQHSNDIAAQLMCRLAKEKRERLRYAQPAADYVPLGTGASLAPGTATSTERGKKGDASGSDEDDDDPRLRMSFLGSGKPGQKQQPVFAVPDQTEVRSFCSMCKVSDLANAASCALSAAAGALLATAIAYTTGCCRNTPGHAGRARMQAASQLTTSCIHL